MPKQNKIIVCICSDDQERRRMIQRMAVKLRLAMTPSEANKHIRSTPAYHDLNELYFVLIDTINLGAYPAITQQLYRMAIQGIAVVVGTKNLKPQFEFMCEIYNEGDI